MSMEAVGLKNGGGGHRVNSVQTLHDDSFSLFNNVVVGGNEYSSDSIISNLGAGISNLKNTWQGKDAGVQIENVVRVYNAMIGIRETLATLATISSQIAANYRDIQNSNGAGLESFGTVQADTKTTMEDYVDNADTINITPEANNGKAKIDAANNAIEQFIQEARKYYNNIMQNWTSGSQRDELITRFETFLSNSNSYKETLNSVSQSITTAIGNYGL